MTPIDHRRHSPSGRPQHSPGNSREHERFAWDRPVQICWFHNGSAEDPFTVTAHDISAGGMGLLSHSMVHPGTQGIALLPAANHRALLRCFEIVHCHYDAQVHAHVIGARWIADPPGGLPVEVKWTATGPKMAPIELKAPRR
jgi:hypothetical protein